MEPAWKSIVRDLKESGFESKYLDRLYDRIGPAAASVAAADGFRALEREILEEMAEALRRAEDKVNFTLLQADVARKEFDLAEPGRRDACYEVYEQRRLAARRAIWEYKVHREALGLIEHSIVDELYAVPPPLPH